MTGRPFDPTQPGAIRLRETARKMKADSLPVAVEITEAVWLPDEHRRLEAGERTTLAAGKVDALVASGCAVRL